MRSKVLLGMALLGLAVPAAWAVSYASGITALGGGDYGFVLNQDSPSVIVNLDGGGTIDLGALPRGLHMFNIGAATGFDISVVSSEAAGWNQYIPDGVSTNFYSPLGVSIDKNPASPNFGKAFISESRTATTSAGRSVTSGIYMLYGDASDAGWANGGVDWAAAGNSSPFKSTIGPDGHLYVADFSRDLAWEFSADMSVATQLIDASNKTASQYVSSIYVEGTQAGGDRKIYLVDQNYYAGQPGRKGLIQYDLGGNATATPGDIGVQYIGPDYFGFYPMDVARDSDGDWYMAQFRFSPNLAPPITKFADGTPPINLAEWEASMAYTGAYGIDINEEAGIVAYGHYYTGFVVMFDMETGEFIGEFDAGNRIRDLAFDAAGNLVTVDNSAEYARFWSPGGNWIATTGSDGTFMLIPEPAALALLALGTLLLRRR